MLEWKKINAAPENGPFEADISNRSADPMFTKAIRGFVLVLSLMLLAATAGAAPYAAFVMDARTGEVLHSRNADTRLYPASLTKMMTLYLVFNEIESGRMSLDQKITISRNAASEPPSKLGLKAGQKIALRYLIRAAAVKSANDAATAIGEAISGSEEEFARYMTRAARAMGMSRTTFKNAHGLTQAGHLSTARDMATLGRRLFYDFPEYYNLFSRITTDVPGRTLYNTNRKFLRAYQGADGIKTGYTAAAGFNLVASARRGNERIIAAMFGGTSTAQRNQQVAKLLDMGFDRAPTRVATVRPPALHISPKGGGGAPRGSGLVRTASLPVPRRNGGAIAPAEAPATVAMARNIDNLVSTVVTEAQREAAEAEAAAIIAAITASAPVGTPDSEMERPLRRPASIADTQVASLEPATVTDATPVRPVYEFGDWAIQIGTYRNRVNTEKLLLKTALMDLDSLEGAARKVEVTQVQGVTMYRARFVGLSQADAVKACARLQSRGDACDVVGPGG